MKKIAIGATVLVVGLALAGCSSTLDETPQEVNDSVVVPEAIPTEEPTREPTKEPVKEPASHATGDTVTVEDWDVKITEVALNANNVIEATNEFNDAPVGQYVLVTLTGTNVSTSEFKDLYWISTSILGSDKRVYDEVSAVTPFDDTSEPTEAAPGGTVSAQFVFDVPAAALGSGASVLLGYDNEQFIIVP